MCVLLVHHRVRADAPIVLLSNRDESYARAFSPPARWPGPAGIVAPRDLEARGTWVGVNGFGVVAAITNRPSPPPRDGPRSRGIVIPDLLEARSASEARARLDALVSSEDFNPFNLVVADRETAWVLSGPRERGVSSPGSWTDVSKGSHVLTNLHDLDAFPIPADGLARPGEPLGALVTRLERLAADRTTPMPGDHRICKVGRTRGTVCSAVVSVAADPARAPSWRFAAGPPHTTPFVETPASVFRG